jgi:hypothetical protein
MNRYFFNQFKTNIMKKTILLFCVLFAISITNSFSGSFGINKSSSDVESTFMAGDKVINFGLGIGSTLYAGRYYNTRIPPISLSAEYGAIDDFIIEDLTLGIGGYLGFSSSRYRWTGFGTEYGWDYNNIIVGGRGAVHYPLVENLDTYTGLMLGFNIVSSRSVGTTVGAASSGGIIYSWFAGGRYYLNDSFALLGELGYGIAYLTIGVSLKL